MPKGVLDNLKTILNERRSKGVVGGCREFASPPLNRSLNRSLLPPVAPPDVPHPINPAGYNESLLGTHFSTCLETIDSGSNEFLSWIDGNGPFVPKPLPADSVVPQVVVVHDWCHGLTDEMFEKEYLECGSSQFGAYPSLCIAPVNDLPLPGDDFPTLCHEMIGSPIVELGETRLAFEKRFNDVLSFQNLFTNRSSTNRCNNNVEKGTCIWSNGTHSWSDKSCGIIWVAVHGIDSICVVTRNEILDRELTLRMCALDLVKEDLLDVFRHGIICKVQDLADPPVFDQSMSYPVQLYERPSQLSDRSFKKPFGVVSVIPGTHEGSGHEVSSAEYDEEKAIKFLQKKMESGEAFTYDKTVQTAISAFRHLFRQKFKANEIRVVVWKEDGDIVKELPSRDDRSIEEHVAAIRGR